MFYIHELLYIFLK